MSRTFYSMILSVIMCFLFFIFSSMWQEGKPVPRDQLSYLETSSDPTIHSPFKTFIFGVGIVEGKGGNVNIGASLNRIVEKIPVKVGDHVKKGTPLIMFESGDLLADVMVQEQVYHEARANLNKIKALPRSEELEEADANLKIADLDVEQTHILFEMVQNLKDSRALSQEEANRHYFAYQQALAKKQQVVANFNKVKNGAWEPDVDIGQLKVLQAKAQLMQSKSNLQRTVIRSPIQGTILQIKIHEGEVPSIDSSRNPLMVLADTDELNLKVSINQYDVPYFQSNAPAVAFFQGNRRYEFPLEFVRIEPILVSKQNLTNDISEKVDTDVLNIVYRIKPSQEKIYIGQQMDVHIEAKYLPETSQL